MFVLSIQEETITCKTSKEERRNVLFNDTLNTLNYSYNGVRHMVKDHVDSGIGNLMLLLHIQLIINNKRMFLLYAPYHGQDNTYHGLCYTCCVALVEMGKVL